MNSSTTLVMPCYVGCTTTVDMIDQNLHDSDRIRQTGLPFHDKGFLHRLEHHGTADHSLCCNMALRMVCRAISSRCLAAVPRAATTQCNAPRSLLRHVAGSLTRPAWRSEATTIISLRSFHASTIVRSALTDLLQDEIEYEKENYQPPEVTSLA